MKNRVISYSFGGFEVFLKLPVIIIVSVCETNVLALLYFDIYQFRESAGWVNGLSYISHLLLIKTEKLLDRDVP